MKILLTAVNAKYIHSNLGIYLSLIHISRLRPRTLDEVVGQQHIVGKNKLLYRAIQADKLGSIIFYGPPGTGKTTLAKVIANTKMCIRDRMPSYGDLIFEV